MKQGQKLTVKERKFVASKVKGNTNAKAYLEAGYKATTRAVADSNAYKVLKKEKISLGTLEIISKRQTRGVRSLKELERRKNFNLWSWVYILECQGAYKVGYATNPKHRQGLLQTGNPYNVNFVYARRFLNARSIEGAVHILYSPCKIRGEWFALTETQLQDIIEKLEAIDEAKVIEQTQA